MYTYIYVHMIYYVYYIHQCTNLMRAKQRLHGAQVSVQGPALVQRGQGLGHPGAERNQVRPELRYPLVSIFQLLLPGHGELADRAPLLFQVL